MANAFISVIVPYLNQPEQLPRCLASLEAQNYPADLFEIIVVDNDSTIVPRDICSQFAKVRLEQELTPGPGPARNRGVATSKGDILAFIDADCIADSGWLAAIASDLGKGNRDQIIGGDVRIAVTDPDHPTMLEAYESIYSYQQEEYVKKKGFSGTGNLAIRRVAYDAVGPFAGIELAEDRDWGRRATSMGYSIRYVPKMIVYHPARQSISELTAKWDRHISHDFEEYGQGLGGRLRWLAMAIAVAGSPPYEILRIARSKRVAGLRPRWLALIAMARIRLHRARGMVNVLLGRTTAQASRQWNRG